MPCQGDGGVDEVRPLVPQEVYIPAARKLLNNETNSLASFGVGTDLHLEASPENCWKTLKLNGEEEGELQMNELQHVPDSTTLSY